MTAAPPVRHAWSSLAVALRAVAGAAGFAVIAMLLIWAAGTPVSCLIALRASTASGFDALLPAAVGALAWCGLLWFAALVAVEIAAKGPGLVGRACARAAARCAPRGMRAAARWLVGITLMATPLCSATAVAMAATNAAPNLDRPVASSGASANGVSSSAAASGGIDLDRPHQPQASTSPPRSIPVTSTASTSANPAPPYVAPAPPAAAKVALPNGAPLLTGTPHRDVDDDGGYVVRRGDALWDIAARHLGPDATAADIAREWPRWYAANRAVIGADPNLLRPGELLHAPSA
jgi:hypothetical protein